VEHPRPVRAPATRSAARAVAGGRPLLPGGEGDEPRRGGRHLGGTGRPSPRPAPRPGGRAPAGPPSSPPRAAGGAVWSTCSTAPPPPCRAGALATVGRGAPAAAETHADRLFATLAAFFLAVGISAHALDELNGHPLKTQLADRTLIALSAVSLAGAIGIGIAG